MPNLSKMKSSDVAVEEFSFAIQGSWNKAIGSLIETAQLIKRAEEQLGNGQLRDLKKDLEVDCPHRVVRV